MLVVAQGAVEGATLVATTGAVAAALAEGTEGGGTARGDVQRGLLVNLLPLVFGLEHGPRRGGRGSRQEVSRAMAGRAFGSEAFTLLLRLS